MSKQHSSAASVLQQQPAFGSRVLKDPADVFEHNAWDHVEWTEEMEQFARERIQLQQNAAQPVDTEHLVKDAAKHWDEFYTKNETKFFKDRHWLTIEFPELFVDASSLSRQDTAAAGGAEERARRVVLEVGCGVGNTVFPLLEQSADTTMFVYGCDFSTQAVQLVKNHSLYDSNRCCAFVWDVTDPRGIPVIDTHPLAPESVDVILLIFVFSALHPSSWDQVVANLDHILKPGGLILFRDYGRYDLAQLRFKPQRLISDNFYTRGDQTCVYFFTSEELATIFGQRFQVVDNAVDRRLIVNRQRKVCMQRVWLQAKFRKPVESDAPPRSS